MMFVSRLQDSPYVDAQQLGEQCSIVLVCGHDML
jgi:hypothetical protein